MKSFLPKIFRLTNWYSLAMVLTLVVIGTTIFGIYWLLAYPADPPNPQTERDNPYYIYSDPRVYPDLDNCPAGPGGPRCYNSSGIEIGCTNPDQADWNLDLEGDICDPCGNGRIDSGEDCDKDNLGGRNCLNLGFSGGTLACSPQCRFDTAACFYCGDNQVNTGEECDLNNLKGKACPDITPGWTSTGVCADSLPADADYPQRCNPDDPTSWSAACGTGVACLGGLSCYNRSDLSCRFDTCNCCGDSCIGSAEYCDGDSSFPASAATTIQTAKGAINFRSFMLSNQCLVCGASGNFQTQCLPGAYYNCASLAATAGLPFDPTKFLWLSDTEHGGITQMVALESRPEQNIEVPIPFDYNEGPLNIKFGAKICQGGTNDLSPCSGAADCLGGACVDYPFSQDTVNYSGYLCSDIPAPWGKCVVGQGVCSNNHYQDCDVTSPSSWPAACGVASPTCVQTSVTWDTACGQCERLDYFRVGDVVHEYEICDQGTPGDNVIPMNEGIVRDAATTWPQPSSCPSPGPLLLSPSRTAVNVEKGEAWAVFRASRVNLDDFYLAHFHEDVGVLAVCKIQDSTAVLGNGGGVQVDLHGDAWIGAGRGNFLYKYRGGLGYCSADSGQVERRQCDPRDNTTWPSGCGDCLRNDDCQPMRTISNTMGTYGLAITPNGDLWQSRMTTGRNGIRNGIAFYRDPDSLTDGWTAAFDLPGSGLLGINYGIGTDKFGNAYINTAATNDGLYFASYSPTSGINMRKLIGPGAPADNTYRRGVGIDSSGAIWVADQGNNRIERVVNGSVVDTAGSLPQLDFPYGVSGDSAGYVWAISNGQFGRVIAPACRFQVTGDNDLGLCFQMHVVRGNYLKNFAQAAEKPYMYSDFLGMNRAMVFRKRISYYPDLNQSPLQAFDLAADTPQSISNLWRYRWGKIKYDATVPLNTTASVQACFSAILADANNPACPASPGVTTGWVDVSTYNGDFANILYRKKFLRLKVELRSNNPDAEPYVSNLRVSCDGDACQ